MKLRDVHCRAAYGVIALMLTKTPNTTHSSTYLGCCCRRRDRRFLCRIFLRGGDSVNAGAKMRERLIILWCETHPKGWRRGKKKHNGGNPGQLVRIVRRSPDAYFESRTHGDAVLSPVNSKPHRTREARTIHQYVGRRRTAKFHRSTSNGNAMTQIRKDVTVVF